ncbi:MAG: AAA family ATPase [Nitrospinae bacterium]|nr:AAA family ATPase [Nitrospinota bacterium]
MKIDPSHVEVPKEEIDRIVERYGCTRDEAVRSWLNARSAGEEAFRESLSRSLGETEKYEIPEIPLHTPAQIKAHMDRYVIGQEDYKKRLSIAAAYHFAVVKALREGHTGPKRVKRFRKKNTLICGPSGSGKTYCAEILGDFMEAPTLIVDATDYTEAGYVGKSADDMIRELIQLAPGESKGEKAQYVEKNGGIIFIDEMDKKAKDGKVIGHDISREGFQRAVLKLIERKQISVEDPMSPAGQIQEMMNQQKKMFGGGHGAPSPSGTVSTENILFILGGSFARTHDDLESIVKKRLERGAGRFREDGSVTVTGFISSKSAKDENPRNYFKEADADDYIEFGVIPELVGRAPVRTYVNALSKNDLIRIMTETEDSVLEQYRFEFSLFGVDLTFDEQALLWIAGKAENRKTGARALISVFEDILTEFQFELPGSAFKELRVTREICESPKDALLRLMERSPFADFADKFMKDHGVSLRFEAVAEERIREYAAEKGLSLTAAIADRLAGASALNYMDWQGPFTVTAEVLDDPRYFDRLFVTWRQEKLARGEAPLIPPSPLP